MWKYKILYHLKATGQNVREHGATLFLSLAAVGFTLLLFSAYMLLMDNIQSMKKRLGENLQITLYLEKTINTEERRDLEKAVSGMEAVESVQFRSPGKAMESLKRSLGEAAGVLQGLPENPLPPSLEVRLKKPFRNMEGIRSVSLRMGSLKSVTEVEYGGEWIERFFAFVRILRWLGLSLGMLLLAATVIVISSTLTLGFFARKEEIEILRLVGATESHVRVPFFLEAMLQGMGGALIALAMLWILYHLFRMSLEASWSMFTGWVQFHFLSPLAIVSIVFLGVFLGILSCLVSFSRFSAKP